MKPLFKNVLIVADIEGSSGCWDYEASSFMTEAWCRACVEMSRDVNAVGQALLGAGVEQVRVKDFHRTGFNLLTEWIDPEIKVASGYRRKPVPGIGDPGDARAVMFLGMHAASGTAGFLAHTLTSRMERLEVNGRPMPEVELFAASLAPWGLRPIFFSGCPVACKQARQAIAGIEAYPIDKSMGREAFDVASWRAGLAQAAVRSLTRDAAAPYLPPGPFRAVIQMQDGRRAARRIGRRWGLPHRDSRVFVNEEDIHGLYQCLIRICYLRPATERILPFGLWAYNLWGRLGQFRARRKLRELTVDGREGSLIRFHDP
jgi:D-aminopeptidase